MKNNVVNLSKFKEARVKGAEIDKVVHTIPVSPAMMGIIARAFNAMVESEDVDKAKVGLGWAPSSQPGTMDFRVVHLEHSKMITTDTFGWAYAVNFIYSTMLEALPIHTIAEPEDRQLFIDKAMATLDEVFQDRHVSTHSNNEFVRQLLLEAIDTTVHVYTGESEYSVMYHMAIAMADSGDMELFSLRIAKRAHEQ